MAALETLTDQALVAVKACEGEEVFHMEQQPWEPGSSATSRPRSAHAMFTQKTLMILKAIDPMQINQAMAALYTTWMGVAVVLEKQFARTIALSVSMADTMRPAVAWLLSPAVYHCVPRDYHKWVPLLVEEWMCKAIAMSLVWRIQRVLTTYSSALAGGLLFSRSLLRMWSRHCNYHEDRMRRLINRRLRRSRFQPRDQGWPSSSSSSMALVDDENGSPNEKAKFALEAPPPPFWHVWFEQFVGWSMAAAGLYVQIGKGFAFVIPFPWNLITWPFEIAEHWIQWQITKRPSSSSQ